MLLTTVHTLDDPRLETLERLAATRRGAPDAIEATLALACELYGYIPLPVLERLAAVLAVPERELYRRVSFFHFFNTGRPGRVHILVCLDTCCYRQGAGEVYAALTGALAVGPGQTTPDGDFTLEVTHDHPEGAAGPVVWFGEDQYEGVSADSVPALLAEYRRCSAAALLPEGSD